MQWLTGNDAVIRIHGPTVPLNGFGNMGRSPTRASAVTERTTVDPCTVARSRLRATLGRPGVRADVGPRERRLIRHLHRRQGEPIFVGCAEGPSRFAIHERTHAFVTPWPSPGAATVGILHRRRGSAGRTGRHRIAEGVALPPRAARGAPHFRAPIARSHGSDGNEPWPSALREPTSMGNP